MKRTLIFGGILLIMSTTLLMAQTNGSITSQAHDSTDQRITTIGSDAFYHGHKLNDDEIQEKLAPFPEISLKYDRGVRFKQTGNILTACGGGVVAGGILLINTLPKDTEGTYTLSIFGIEVGKSSSSVSPLVMLATTMGVASLTTGIVFISIGKGNKNGAINNYNEAISHPTSNRLFNFNYQLGLLDNGNLGLRLNF